MKQKLFFSIFFSIFLLSSCSMENQETFSGRIVHIMTLGGIHCGRGVLIDSDHLLTVRHIFSTSKIEKCDRIRMGDAVSQITQIPTESPDDGVILSFTPGFPQKGSPLRLIPEEKISQNLEVFALVTRSGSMQKLSGKILKKGVSSIGYDPSLQNQMTLSDMIEIDIVFESGESGSPVWTLSGELIGVVSAVDKKTGKSYIVRAK